MGCDRAEIRTMSLQAFILRLQAHERTERQKWQRTLALVNTARQMGGNEPIRLTDMLDGALPGSSSREEYEALKGRHIDWITNSDAEA